MTNSYIVILKSKNIFSSNINKVYLFASFNDAYDYAINIETLAIKYFEKLLTDGNPGWRSVMENFELDKSEKEQSRKTGRSEDVIKMMSYVRKMGLNDALCDAVSGIRLRIGGIEPWVHGWPDSEVPV